MKKEDLLAQGLTEEQVSYVMAENGRDIEKVKTKLTAAETARDEYKEVRYERCKISYSRNIGT